MVRLSSFLIVLIVVNVACASARLQLKKAKGGAPVLAQNMKQSLTKIASRYMTTDDVKDLVELGSPKTDIIQAIDDLETEIRTDLRAEEDVFAEFSATRKQSIADNQASLDSQQAHLVQLQSDILALKSTLTSQTNEQSGLTADEDALNAEIQRLTTQLDEVTQQRRASHDSNAAIIASHQSAVAALRQLLQLVQNVKIDDTLLVKTKFGKVAAQLANVHDSRSASVGRLVKSVNKILVEAGKKRNDPTDVQLKNRLLGMIQNIVDGVQSSLNLYLADEEKSQATFEGETKPQLEALIATNQNGLAATIARLAQVEAEIADTQASIERNGKDQGVAQDTIASLQALIQTLQESLAEKTAAHNAKVDQAHGDLDALEEVRQYVNEKISGMSPGEQCHPEEPKCPRCLYDEQCQQGDKCSNEGMCVVAVPTVFA